MSGKRMTRWRPGVPFVELSDGKRYVLAPYQKPFHRDGVWVVHHIDLPVPNGWQNLRVYRDEPDKARRMWSVGFTDKGKPARGVALKHLESVYPGMTAWLIELVKGNRPPAPKVSGELLMLERAGRVPMEKRKAALRALRILWKAKQPLSLIPQTRQTGRYAPEVLSAKLGIDAKDAEAMLRRWKKLKIVRNLCVDKNNKTYGLKVSDVADENLL